MLHLWCYRWMRQQNLWCKRLGFFVTSPRLYTIGSASSSAHATLCNISSVLKNRFTFSSVLSFSCFIKSKIWYANSEWDKTPFGSYASPSFCVTWCDTISFICNIKDVTCELERRTGVAPKWFFISNLRFERARSRIQPLHYGVEMLQRQYCNISPYAIEQV